MTAGGGASREGAAVRRSANGPSNASGASGPSGASGASGPIMAPRIRRRARARRSAPRRGRGTRSP
ncbi:hypothetical protein D9V30_13190 [Mycetocola reblochoni]|uniref:Uncharacterized protein n=1 Tax=Mycetocola reblochoni TaxID=331618 RepID=A0A3L6ZJ23_9MICO|nr:hypothetical protein D9V30_13190 [Mycetocola reblochoni]